MVRATLGILPTTYVETQLTVTLLNECTPALASATSGNNYAYTILDPTQTDTLTSFMVTGEPTGVSCFTYQLVPPNPAAPFVIMSNYPTLTIGPTFGGETSSATVVY